MGLIQRKPVSRCPLAKLLVSVRSVSEAQAAVDGGAAVIDVKEPSLGPLGRASCATWRAIRAAVPAVIPVSVALGELADLDPGSIRPECFAGIAFRKAGPAGLGGDWSRRWELARQADQAATGWVAVIYADWTEAQAPDPDAVIAAALGATDCPGLLVDSWDKTRGCPIGNLAEWQDRISRVQASGRFVALAGRLDRRAIERLSPLGPDLFAVRGAACVGGRRDGMVNAELVTQLAESAAATSGTRAGINSSANRPPRT